MTALLKAVDDGAGWKPVPPPPPQSQTNIDPEKMQATFASGAGDYIHQQGPVGIGEIVASVGAAMPPVAFSSLCCGRHYQRSEGYLTFLETYSRAREWVRTQPTRRARACRRCLPR